MSVVKGVKVVKVKWVLWGVTLNLRALFFFDGSSSKISGGAVRTANAASKGGEGDACSGEFP